VSLDWQHRAEPAGVAVRVDHLGKRFRLYHERNQYLKASLLRGRRARYSDFWAVDDVSFDINKGESFGIIGHNGSGKSTMLKCLARILKPDRGSVVIDGSVSALLELGAGFHPELSGRENIYLNGAILGLSRRQIDACYDEIVEFAGLQEFIDTPVKNYSSGMYVRLGFAVAINVDPDVLIIDEVLAVGDESFQRKCGEKIADFREAGKTIVLVSHGLGQVRNLCDRALWMDHGKAALIGSASEVVDAYSSESHADRDTNEHEGSRWGTGEARIRKIEMLDETGQAVVNCRTGQAVRFRIHFEVRTAVREPIFGFAVFHLDGALITGPNTGEYGKVPDRIEGAGHVDFVVPSMPLLEGTYDVSVGISERTLFHTYDLWQKPFRFDVLRGDPFEQHGMVTFRGAWEGESIEPRRNLRT
jgi:ABC-2 type transport system ATP-binding protein